MERATLRFTIGMLRYAFGAVDVAYLVVQSIQHLEIQYRCKYLAKEWALLMALIYFPLWVLLADIYGNFQFVFRNREMISTDFHMERICQLSMVICYVCCVAGKSNSSGLSLASLTIGMVASVFFQKDRLILIICSSFAINVLLQLFIMKNLPLYQIFSDLRSFLLDENLDNSENFQREESKCGYHKKSSSLYTEEIFTMKLLSDAYEAPNRKSHTFETSEDRLMDELNSLKSTELHQRVDQISKAGHMVCNLEKHKNLENIDSCADTPNYEFTEIRRALASIILEFSTVFGFNKDKVICKVSNEIHSFYYLGADKDFQSQKCSNKAKEMMKFNVYTKSIAKKPIRSFLVPKNDLYYEMGSLKLGLLDKNKHSSKLTDSSLSYRRPKNKLKFDFTLELDDDFYTCIGHTLEFSPKSHSQLTQFTDECIADENVNNGSICISAPHETQATNTISASCKTMGIIGAHPCSKKAVTRLKSHQDVSGYKTQKTAFY